MKELGRIQIEENDRLSELSKISFLSPPSPADGDSSLSLGGRDSVLTVLKLSVRELPGTSELCWLTGLEEGVEDGCASELSLKDREWRARGDTTGWVPMVSNSILITLRMASCQLHKRDNEKCYVQWNLWIKDTPNKGHNRNNLRIMDKAALVS